MFFGSAIHFQPTSRRTTPRTVPISRLAPIQRCHWMSIRRSPFVEKKTVRLYQSLFSGSPKRWDGWHIIPQKAIYKWYILPIGGLYATYHLLGEPETTIDSMGPWIMREVTRGVKEWKVSIIFISCRSKVFKVGWKKIINNLRILND